jgi:hypothetical protein
MRNVSDKSCWEDQNTYFLFNKFLRISCHLWDNVEKYDRAILATNDNIIRPMRFAFWMTTATDTILNCFSTAAVVTRTRLSVTVYVQCLSYYCWSLTIDYLNLERRALEKVVRVVLQISCLCGTRRISTVFRRDSPVNHILSEINAVRIHASYLLKTAIQCYNFLPILS